MNIRQIKIEFNVTPDIKRYVYDYSVESDKAVILIDSGVSGCESIIEKAVEEDGYNSVDIKAVLLTHAHPDHIGTAAYFSEKYGAKIYASAGERPWIEDIDLQFSQRPIPNFYALAGKSARVDIIVKDSDTAEIDGIKIKVIGTSGHSADEVSYQIDNAVFVGDAIPVKGDIPIFVNLESTKKSLDRLESLIDADFFYPAWDRTYQGEEIKIKIAEGKEIVNIIEKTVNENDKGQDNKALVDSVCERLNMLFLKTNPLFARTVEACRKE